MFSRLIDSLSGVICLDPNYSSARWVEKTMAPTEEGKINKFVRPRWPYDMRPSAPAEKYMCVIVIR